MSRVKLLAGCFLAGLGLWWVLNDQAPVPSDKALNEMPGRQSGLPSSRWISSADLPPPGTRSLFDHHIARQGGVPYPLTELIDSFRGMDRWGEGVVSLLIPDGRSLARGHADYRQPRVLVATQLDPVTDDSIIAPIYNGRLFIGFAEAIDTLEVISYNEAAGRFEFQLVTDYCEDCSPKVTYAKRDICLACHHSGSPIFAVRPWSETNAHQEVARRIAARQSVPWSNASTTQYQGSPVSTQIVMPETFDELVGAAGDLMLAQRLWLDGCGESGLECRRALLSQALFLLMRPGAFNPQSEANQQLRMLQAAYWPDKGIVVPDNSLPDRVPPEPSMFRAWQQQLSRLWWTLTENDPGREDSAARLAEFGRLPRLPTHLDPLSLRAPVEVLQSDSLAGVHAVSKLFSPRDREQLLALVSGRARQIQEVIHAGKLDHLLGTAPLSRVAVLKALSSLLGQAEPSYCCLDTSSLAPPVSETPNQLAIRPGSALEVFEKYCFACHRGNPVGRLDFMAGDSEDKVLASIRSTPGMLEVLDYHGAMGDRADARLMPPEGSLQRGQLEAAYANQSGELERMIDAVQMR